MTARRAVILTAVGALFAVAVRIAGGVAFAADMWTDDTSDVSLFRQRLSFVTQSTGGAGIGLLVLFAALAVVVLAERNTELGSALSSAAFAIAIAVSALALVGAVNYLSWPSGPVSQRVEAVLSALTTLPLSALACWLTAPKNLQRSR